MTPKALKHREIHSVGIIAKRNIVEHKETLHKIVNYLKKHKKEILLDENCVAVFPKEKGYGKHALLNKIDLAIVLGGDGSLLKTARCLSRKKVIILGINFGTLGFLTECTPDKMFDCLGRIFAGQFDVDKRAVLRVTIYRKHQKIDTFLALNDAVINQGAFARLIIMNLEIDGRQLAKVKADGLIVATPTGSTAHALSAGGPIVHPKIEGLTITPICPSSLSMRPIILPDTRQLTIRVETERKEEEAIIGLTLDGQDMINLKFGDIIKIRRSHRNFYLARTGNRYYKMLRTKLHWGGI